jgi:hypothetical protein
MSMTVNLQQEPLVLVLDGDDGLTVESPLDPDTALVWAIRILWSSSVIEVTRLPRIARRLITWALEIGWRRALKVRLRPATPQGKGV